MQAALLCSCRDLLTHVISVYPARQRAEILALMQIRKLNFALVLSCGACDELIKTMWAHALPLLLRLLCSTRASHWWRLALQRMQMRSLNWSWMMIRPMPSMWT